MWANDQIKIVARQIARLSGERVRQTEGRIDRQQLWELARHASRIIEAVAEMDEAELTAGDRSRRARYLVCEVEFALEAARRAKVVLDWAALRAYESEEESN